MKIFVSAMTMTLVLASPVALSQDAPQQTPENAHRFLGIVANEHGVQIEVLTSHGFNMGAWRGDIARERPVSGLYRMDPFAVTAYTGSSCRSHFQWNDDWNAALHSDYGNLTTNRIGVDAIASETDSLDDLSELDIDWSKVSGVKRVEYLPQVELIGFARLTLPTPELATRVQFAAEFLKNACDPTAGTGF